MRFLIVLGGVAQLGERLVRKGQFADIIVFLQATSPLRKPEDISNAIDYFNDEKADSLFSVTSIADLTIWQNDDRNWRSLNFNYKDFIESPWAQGKNYVRSTRRR